MYAALLLGFFVFSSVYSCDVSAHRTHLCGDPCKLMRGRGCLGKCTKVSHSTLFQLDPAQLQVTGHAEDEHMCSALAHFCGEVRFHPTVAGMFCYGDFVLSAVRPQEHSITWREDVPLSGKL